MRASTIVLALLAVPAAAFASSGGGPVKEGPVGIPFTCSDGRSLRVVYGKAGPRDTAELRFAGDEVVEMEPAPTIYGTRFSHEIAPDRLLIWSTDGINGSLLETTPDAMMEGREIARCDRLGWGSPLDAQAPAEAHGEGHHAAEEAH